MKSLRLLPCLVLLAAAPVFAAFESARLAPDNFMPDYPAALKMMGVTRGYAIVALSIDAEGKGQDTLVLSYNDIHFARTSLATLQEWQFIPARLDGVAVPVQVDLRFDYKLEGAVISANVINHFFFDGFKNAGDYVPVYQPGHPDELDRPLVRIAGDAPHYANQAAKDGVRGLVKVSFYIDEKGEVRLPAVIANPHPYLMEQAVAAVRTWKFEPPTQNGQPVLVAASQEFNFGDGR